MSGASKNRASSVSDLLRRALLRQEVERRFDIASNRATAELRDLGPNTLPAIQSALLDILRTDDNPSRQFPGLSEVLNTFIDMAREHDIHAAEDLLRSLPPEDQVEALTAIWSIWLGRSKTGPIPDELLESIQKIAATDTAASEKAKALLGAYSKLGPRPRRAPA